MFIQNSSESLFCFIFYIYFKSPHFRSHICQFKTILLHISSSIRSSSFVKYLSYLAERQQMFRSTKYIRIKGRGHNCKKFCRFMKHVYPFRHDFRVIIIFTLNITLDFKFYEFISRMKN